MPVRLEVCGLLLALSATFNFPVLVPVAVGLNTTLMVQLVLAARLAPQVVVETLKSERTTERELPDESALPPEPAALELVASQPARPGFMESTRVVGDQGRGAVEPALSSPPLEDRRFSPSGAITAPLQLDIERPAPASLSPEAQPDPTSPGTGSSPTYEAPLCPRHRIPRVSGECTACHAETQPVPGRLWQGALRKRPPVRYGAGVLLGLGLGFVFSAPYARRQERQVTLVREAANRDRYRGLEEARLKAAQLDGEADDLANVAMMKTIGLWLALGAAAFAGWLRLT